MEAQKEPTGSTIFLNLFEFAVMGAGALLLGAAIWYLPAAALNWKMVVLAICTVIIASFLLVKIPAFKAHIALSDVLLYLTLLMFGGEAAIILAAADTFVSSKRFCRRYRTVFLNTGVLVISMSCVYIALVGAGLYSESQLSGYEGYYQDFLLALCLITLTQFAVNTSIASFYDVLKEGVSFWENWNKKYLWTFLTYAVGAIGAGVIIQLVNFAGFVVALLAIPILSLIYLTYRVYLKNVEMSLSQAEQANEYADELRIRSEALEESEHRFKSAFNYAPIGIALVAPDGRCLKANHALSKILGYTSEELLELEFQTLIYPHDMKVALRDIRSVMRGNQPSCQMSHRFQHKNGNVVWAEWSLSKAGDTNNGANLIFQLQDITAKKKAEEKLQYDANHDGLTELPNRMYFIQRLEAALERKRSKPQYHVSVLFIDLDRFKYVNDSLGHVAGDQLLVAIAARLRDSMRPPDIVARLGGDEFVILVEGRFFNEEITQIAERIQRQFRLPYTVNGREVYSSASIGILHAGEGHLTAEDMMRDADTAMYHAKRSGKARHEVFNEAMHVNAKETLQLETDLRGAIENSEISVYYQPIYRLSDMQIVGIESLARWDHPEMGEIAPERFVKLAEEIGWIDALGEAVLKKAVAETLVLFRSPDCPADLKLSVNISCKQFARTQLVPRIKQIVDEIKFPITCLKLEITESVIIAYQEQAVEMLHHLRGLGIEVDIDDFGTGYSNLSYLVRLPISTLKIDRSFVNPIEEKGANAEIVKTIISLARNLGLKVVAEGIESEAQAEALRELGCERGQGYFLSKPMPISELIEMISIHKPIEPLNQSIEEISVVSGVQ